jgi:hypothetical protein
MSTSAAAAADNRISSEMRAMLRNPGLPDLAGLDDTEGMALDPAGDRGCRRQ